MIAIAQEGLHVCLGGWMLVHVQVHGWCNEDRRLHGEVGGDEHVVGNAMSHLPHRRGGAGSNEHGVCPESEVNMRVPCSVALREELAHHGLMGEGREGDGSDELLAGWRDDHLHLSAFLDEPTDDETGLIGCNGARNAQYYFLSFQHSPISPYAYCIHGGEYG